MLAINSHLGALFRPYPSTILTMTKKFQAKLWGSTSKKEPDCDTAMVDTVKAEDADALPIRLRLPPEEEQDASLRINSVLSRDSFVVSVDLLKQPRDGLVRSNCDIVLVIDVSGSMAAPAPLPGAQDGTDAEDTGLSILDLTKHAARTILSTLKAKDRLGIVAYSTDAKVVEKLTFMTPQAKDRTMKKIEALYEETATNLWSGIRTGWSLFKESKPVNNVQGMFVLTDGMPNHMCPRQGYATKIQEMLAKTALNRVCLPTIHTFGFGYEMRSELMTTIAEVGNGSYAFIPDAGMIGTVFVHAVANLYCTFATCAVLELLCVNKSNSQPVAIRGPTSMSTNPAQNHVMIKLGNLQYGQSRDIWIESDQLPRNFELSAQLTYRLPNESEQVCHTSIGRLHKAEEPQEWTEYHRYRAQLCDFISSLFPYKKNGERTECKNRSLPKEVGVRLESLIKDITSCQHKGPGVESLIAELVGEEPAGQISLALSSTKEENYWRKWGRHYLPSLMHAHQRQVCNTFKDPGPLLYGQKSPLFIQCRDELDNAFDNLPPPKASIPPAMVATYDLHGNMMMVPGQPRQTVHMSRWNSSSNPCFAGTCKVRLGDGQRVAVKSLKKGMMVWTPAGERQILAIVKTRVQGRGQSVCRVGDLLITPWHPINFEGEWRFPVEVADVSLGFTGSVYSVVLTASVNPDAHAIEVGGHVCVTLGHGIVRGDEDDVRSHAFFGNHSKVMKSLSRLAVDHKGHIRCVGLQRRSKDGLASGFLGPRVLKREVRKVSGMESSRIDERGAVMTF
ncbi:hypothetical protein PV10_03130 [Exophiala mesophila]|uniref:VWFA domain-containing protein n=1 Tax=Exophiala mesophila TaxID=212818 RepID=A0A0D1ZLJ9_EXOME|nr:uncharacterized protein PV10_03130 [Exophiala mesophila]KIV95477.1 hypothetical protein PV10_03130 [Exophiala mesophila]